MDREELCASIKDSLSEWPKAKDINILFSRSELEYIVDLLSRAMPSETAALQSAVAPLGYVWPDMVEWMEKSPLAQKGGTVNLHRLKEDPTMVPVYLVAQSASAALEDKPVAWLIVHHNGTRKHQCRVLEVVLSPLTDDHYMDEGDEAWPLYLKSGATDSRTPTDG